MKKWGFLFELIKAKLLDGAHFKVLISRCYREVKIESPLNLPKGTTEEDGRSRRVVRMKALVPKQNKRCKKQRMLRERKKTGRNKYDMI